MTPNEFNAVAWRDFVLWAWGSRELREQFTAATGVDIPSAASAIEAAVDEATGASADRVAKFIEWVTREHWGLDHAPAAYQAALAARAPAQAPPTPATRRRRR